jgi:glyceraldehyde-3-phosphate dehydrogenase (NADP+)
MTCDDLTLLFPAADDANLHEFAIAPIEQRSILVNGRIRNWTGSIKNVLSPLMIRGRDGGLKQMRIGSHPFGDAEAAMVALDAAVAAYDSVRGAWPTMHVAERIIAMQNFLAEMHARRADLTRLIMWEIGKTLADSEKEFDQCPTNNRGDLSCQRINTCSGWREV